MPKDIFEKQAEVTRKRLEIQQLKEMEKIIENSIQKTDAAIEKLNKKIEELEK